jgi:cytoskeletal protein RodZ
MDGLGEKFRKAREARNLTLEEAARMTKIRPAKLAEMEAEDFSQFPSLAYAKGFVLIYGKFLDVDVSPYLEAFETSEQVTVDGYSYLQDNPAPPPRRTEIVPREPRGGGGGQRTSLMPLVIGIVILVGGFMIVRFILDLQRIQPAPVAQATPAPAVIPGSIDGTPPPATPMPGGTPPPAVDVTPAVAAAVPPTAAPAPPQAPTPVATPEVTPEPTPAVAAALPPDDAEVRRAEPVNPEDLAKAQAAIKAEATPTPTPQLNNYQIRPLRRTFVRVTVDGRAIERWLNETEALQVRGQRIAVKTLDPSAVQIRKNGKPVNRGDIDVRVE